MNSMINSKTNPKMPRFSLLFTAVLLAFVLMPIHSLRAEDKPAAVEAQYDDDGNPTYLYELGGKNVLYYEGKGEDAKPVFGWMDFSTYRGWRSYHSDCHVCHGPDGMGSTYAPALKDSLDYLSYEQFSDVIINGRNEEQGAQKGNVMPSFGQNPNVVGQVDNIYRYLRMRHDGRLRRGPRPPKLPKPADE